MGDLIYLSFFIIVYIFVYFCKENKLFIVIGFVTLFAMVRGNTGYDTCNYKEIFNLIGVTPYDELSYLEPGFLTFVFLIKKFYSHPQAILATFAFVEGVFLYLVTREVKNKKFFLFVFLSVFYYPYFFSMIRQGLATIILCYVYICYLCDKRRPYLALIAATIHFSIVPCFIAFRKVAKVMLMLLPFLILSLIVFEQTLMHYNEYTHYGKFKSIISGEYYIEQIPTWHVYAFIFFTMLVILKSAGSGFNKIVFTFLITGLLAADFYFFKTGRVANVAMALLCVLHANTWHLFNRLTKYLVVVYYIYFSLSTTVYTIVYGDEKVQAPYAKEIRTTAGNYHVWLFNDKELCPY